jgi:FkbM family methyltransferase
MTRNKEEQREWVWAKIAKEHPEFTRVSDPFDDPWMVENLVLGNYIGFTPFKGAQVMDIGANVGIWSSFCALNGADVTAYEADPVTYEIMRSSFEKANLQINAVNAAVWLHSGTCQFRGVGESVLDGFCRNGAIQIVGAGINGTGDVTEGKFRGNTPELQPEMQVIPCLSLTEALDDRVWDCVKMDIEGAEFELLMTVPSEVLRRHIRYMHVELHNGWADTTLYQEFIRKLRSVFDFSGGYEDTHPQSEWIGRFHWLQLKNPSR